MKIQLCYTLCIHHITDQTICPNFVLIKNQNVRKIANCWTLFRALTYIWDICGHNYYVPNHVHNNKYSYNKNSNLAARLSISQEQSWADSWLSRLLLYVISHIVLFRCFSWTLSKNYFEHCMYTTLHSFVHQFVAIECSDCFSN